MQAGEELSCRTENPKHMVIKVFCGADGSFELYEDDGITMRFEQGEYVTTTYCLDWTEKRQFVIEPARGMTELIPSCRKYSIKFYGLDENAITGVSLDGKEMTYSRKYDSGRHILTVEVEECDISRELVITLDANTELLQNNLAGLAYEAINRAQIPFAEKENVYRLLNGNAGKECKLSTMESMYMPEAMKSVLREFLLAE